MACFAWLLQDFQDGYKQEYARLKDDKKEDKKLLEENEKLRQKNTPEA